ncbi:hypothetical protein AAK894_12565 [Lachnospiraceae bacterium 46-61]
MDNDKLIENGGFIKLYRSMLKWEWYDDINVKVLFLHLLLKANYEDKKWHGIEIKKGELVTSISHIAKETKLTQQQVRSCIKKLEKTREITIKTTNKFTVIHIEKYGFFQCYETEYNKQITNNQQTNNKQITNNQQTNNKQITNNQQTDNKQITTTKEVKEIKEYKELQEIKEREEGEERKETVYQLIADMYNATCVSFPRCTRLSEAREKAIRARLKKYTVEDFKKVFETAENCDFLKGANRNNWSANFDWLIKDSSMAKVLDGNYTDKIGVQQKSSNIFLDIAQEGGMLF